MDFISPGGSAFAVSVETFENPKELVSVFERFCFRTHAERDLFDAEIDRASDAEKTSKPSAFSKVEFNRRWKVGKIEVAFLDAPPPAGQSCSISSYGTYNESDIVQELLQSSSVSHLSLVESGPIGFTRWIGTLSDSSELIFNRRPYDIEIILKPSLE